MPTSPVIHVLSKEDYTKQHLLTRPDTLPLVALPLSSVRIQSRLLSLTINNLSYARLAHMLGWWDVYHLPASTPAAFADPAKYGRLAAWGYGEVLESTTSAVPAGTLVFGYLPIGTLPVDMAIEVHAPLGQFLETSPLRAGLLPFYNRYLFYASSETAGERQSRGWDALMQPLFETSYMLNGFVFAWDKARLVHPGPDLPGASEDGWTVREADLKDAVVVNFAASGKTALSFAQQLRQNRPADEQPRKIIGVTSAGSRAFVEESGFYDDVVLYGDVSAVSTTCRDTKLVFLDFGARGDAVAAWSAALGPLCKQIVLLVLASEPKVTSPEETTGVMAQAMAAGVLLVNASGMRLAAMEAVGEERYFEDFLLEWRRFKDRGALRGLRLVWAEGMQELEKGWERLCKGEVGPDKGLLFSL